MKIALICTEKLPVPPVAGGAVQLYIDGILPYLSKEHDITVFSVQHPALPNEETRDGVRFIRVSGKTDTAYSGNVKARLDASYDLIHIFNRPRFLLSFMEKLPDNKFSLSLHNEMFHTEKISDTTAIKCIEKAEFINTVSRFIADTVKRRFPFAEPKLNVVYSGVDAQAYTPAWTEKGAQIKQALKKKFGLENKRVLLAVGRLSAKKGQHVILKAAEKVMNNQPDVALVVVGSKWYGKNETSDYTNSLVTLSKNLKGPIVFTGFIPPAQVPEYFSLGDIFICASQWNEPLARVHYEAMAAGLPIITTNRGGNAEVVEGYGNGIVIDDYKDPDIMAEHITYLLNNPDKALEMGQAGRRLAEERYSWSRVAGEIFRPFLQAEGNAGKTDKADTAEAGPVTEQAKEPAKTEHVDEPAETRQAEAPAKSEHANETMKVEQAEELAKTEQAEVSAMTVQTEAPAKTEQAEVPVKTEQANETAKAEQIEVSAKTEHTELSSAPKVPAENISIIGAGYVGLVTGACLASMGMNVLCCDSDKDKIASLKSGVLPIFEPALESLIHNHAVIRERLDFTTDIKQAVDHSDVIFIAVNTPTLEDYTCDLSHVFDVAEKIALHMTSGKVVINKSTVPVGTGEKMKQRIKEILGKLDKNLECDIVSNPEFLKEGSAVHDFMNPERIVIGAENPRAANIVKDIYKEQVLCNVPVLITDIKTAEMIKYASNAFLATKISYINEMANICEHCGADISAVAHGMGLDSRIGEKFLSPGPGFGGSCFPKDVKALAGLSRELGYVPWLMDSVLEVNIRQKNRMTEKIERALGGLEGRKIAILGLAFKPDTDDIRESPSLTIIRALLDKKAIVQVYDPQAMENMRKEYPEWKLTYCQDVYSACEECDCIAVITGWNEFSGLDFKKLSSVVRYPVFMDLRNMYTPEYVRSFGFYYEGVGRK